MWVSFKPSVTYITKKGIRTATGGAIRVVKIKKVKSVAPRIRQREMTYASDTQRRKRSLRLVRDPARGGQARQDILRPGPPLLRFIHPAGQRFDIAPMVPPLLPSGHAEAAASPRRLPKQAAD